MTIPQIFIVLRARWRLAVLVLLSVVAAVLAVNLLRTPQYTASASVLLDVKSPDPIAGVVLPGMTALSYMSTQLGVIQSERVALRALKSISMGDEATLRANWMESTDGKGDFQTWLASFLLLKLDVTPVKDSNLILVSYTSSNPEFAAQAANAFVKAYIDTTVDLRAEPAKQYNSFFDERAKHLREELEAAQARLSAYQRKAGIVATDERLDVENQRLAELTTQMVVLQGIASESGNRQGQLGANPDQMSEVLNSPLIIGLTSDLSRQESRLTELSATLGERNPQVQQVRSTVQQLRSRIDAETKRVRASMTANNNVNQSRLTQLRAAVDEQRNKMLRLKGQRDEASVMVRDVENAQRAYDAIATRATQTSVESQATQTNVSVMKQAMPPSRPSSPRVLLNTVVGAFIGILLAVSVVLIRETFDRRLRTDVEVMQVLRQPLLGVLPVNAHAARGRSRLRLTARTKRALITR
ncbi:MAG: chain-length determining protein [Rhizobacter sp.]|nr:chain-length determining protein [Rhizobacter sp.]